MTFCSIPSIAHCKLTMIYNIFVLCMYFTAECTHIDRDILSVPHWHLAHITWTGVCEYHSMGTSSSATAAVNQRDDAAMSSSSNGCSYEDDCSAPLTPPCFTRVGGAPHSGETSARTDLSYIHPQTAKYLMKATVMPKEKVGWAGGAGRGGIGSTTCYGQAYC